jgi:hypothetical protein
MHKDDWRAGARCRLESKTGANYIKIHFVQNKVTVVQVQVQAQAQVQVQVCATVCIAMLRNVGTVTAATHSNVSKDLHLQQCCLTTQICRGPYLATCPVIINMHSDAVRVSGFEAYTLSSCEPEILLRHRRVHSLRLTVGHDSVVQCCTEVWAVSAPQLPLWHWNSAG